MSGLKINFVPMTNFTPIRSRLPELKSFLAEKDKLKNKLLTKLYYIMIIKSMKLQYIYEIYNQNPVLNFLWRRFWNK